MKTSTILAVTGIIGAFATVTLTNLKIKNDYAKGLVQSAYALTRLPPFRYIKEQLDSTTGLPTVFEVKAGKGNEPGVAVYFDLPLGYSYTVKNDTLLISVDPAMKEPYNSNEPVTIYAPALEGMEVSKGLYYVTHTDTGFLSVKTKGKSAANLKLTRLNKLVLDAADKSRISVTGEHPIDDAILHFTGNAILDLNGASFKKKTLNISDSISLRLTGASIENFGVK